jgi:hypothetical protein
MLHNCHSFHFVFAKGVASNKSCIIVPIVEAALQDASVTVSLGMVALSHRNMHLPAHPVTAALLRELVKETHCNTPTVQVHGTAVFV